MLLDGGYTREAIGMDNPVTHKAYSVRLSALTLIEARFFCQDCLVPDGPCRLASTGVIGLTLFPPLPYHPPHASRSNHLHYQQHGGRLGGVP